MKNAHATHSQPNLLSNHPYGWIYSIVLLGMLSILPFLLTASESLPRWANPQPVIPTEVHPVSKVIVIIVDGLGIGKALEPGSMPFLQRRLPKTAHGIALASFPTVTGPGIRAIMSGHRIINFGEFPGGIQSPEELDSVLARASAAKLRAYGIGQQDWATLFSRHSAHLTIFPYSGPYKSYYDSEIFEAARSIIRKDQWDFLAIHFFGTDPLGHMHGINSMQYHKELLSVDKMIDDLSTMAGPDTTFILTADHGQMDDGSHGGVNMQVRKVPCILWGHAVKPGRIKIYELHDISQTASALLGIPPPVLAEGYPVLEALNLDRRQRSLILVHLLEQRYHRWSALHEVWPSMGGDIAPQIQSILSVWQTGHYEQAQRQAENALKKIDHSLEWFSRSRWIARIAFALWFVVLASCFGLAWPLVPKILFSFYAAWAALFILQLLSPMMFPSLWPIVSLTTLLGAVGLFLFSIISGFEFSNMTRGAWVAWFLAAAGLLSSDIIDVPFWSWAMVWGMVAWRAVRFRYKDIFPQALSLGALIACASISKWSPVYESSIVRNLLPFHASATGRISWPWVESSVMGLILLVGGFRWFTTEKARWKVMTSLTLTPLIAAAISAHLKIPVPVFCWCLCLLSFLMAYLMRLSTDSRALWISILCLAFYRTRFPGAFCRW